LSEPVLVLNRNFEPLNVCGPRRALVLVLREKAQPIEFHDRALRSIAAELPVPSVIRLLNQVRRPVLSRRLSRREVFTRDGFTCQYCGRHAKVLTLDHVVPRVRKGPSTWENVVTACPACNHRKADRTPEEAGMRLLNHPAPPRANPYAHLMGREFPRQWDIYLPWMGNGRRAGALAAV
jgi:5-methylcytosine-specific restriction endonuclease McrA